MRALLSVQDKDGIETIARGLRTHGYDIVSTGNTAATLAAAGIEVLSVSDLTGFPEILGGRVKTLHPAVHGGILARRDDPAHMRELAEHGIEPIDLVVCNLYRFAEASATAHSPLAEVLDAIDIGGVTLLRAAAKNYPHVTVVVRPRDYAQVLRELEEGGSVMEETRRWLAAVAFQHTATYDSLIAAYLRAGTVDAAFPEEATVPLRRLQPLRYGENPHQQAALYTWGVTPRERTATTPSANGHAASLPAHASGTHAAAPAPATPPAMATVAGSAVLHGKELSFNNILDLDAALATVASFTAPAVVIIKHAIPCGLACDDVLLEAYRRAHSGDPVSAYGGIIGCNREVDEATASELSSIFYDAIIAPSFSEAALVVLRQKRNLRLLATGAPIGPRATRPSAAELTALDVRRVSGGVLLQTPDYALSDQEIQRQVVTEREPTLEEVTDLLFAWKAVQHVRSNAIVLAKRLTVVGVGAGQTNRVFSVEIAVQKADARARGSVLASDAYFPFPDGVETACKAGVTAIIQPGGSIRDADAIAMANRYGVAMITTGVRHFRH